MKSLLAGALLAFLPLACVHAVDSVVRNFNDPAITITAMEGEEFTISLESNRTTGYRWVLAQEPDGRVVRHMGTEYRPSDTRLTGAGGTEVWTFKAVGKGNTVLSMQYLRPWEKETPPIQKADFAIHVN